MVQWDSTSCTLAQDGSHGAAVNMAMHYQMSTSLTAVSCHICILGCSEQQADQGFDQSALHSAVQKIYRITILGTVLINMK